MKTIKADGEYYDVLVNIFSKGNKEFVYDITVRENKKRIFQATAYTNTPALKHEKSSSDNSILDSSEHISNNKKYSICDSVGRELSDGQQTYFADSKYGWGQKKNSHPAINVSNDTSTTTPETNRDMSSFDNSMRDSAGNSNNNQKKFSVRDSVGRELSYDQQAYFTDSKVCDGNGDLLVMYDEMPYGGFTVFDYELNYFTPGRD